jgi:hypothetical protein
VVDFLDIGKLRQDYCEGFGQSVTIKEEPLDMPYHGEIFLVIRNEVFEEDSEQYKDFMQVVALRGEIHDGVMPPMNQWFEYPVVPGTSQWELILGRIEDEEYSAEIISGEIFVEISEQMVMRAELENVTVEWPDGEVFTFVAEILATMNMTCRYCEYGDCTDEDIAYVDTWPPSKSEFCVDIYDEWG